MVSVEVYDCGESADEAAAVRALREIKGLDEYHASHPFGLLHWHKRPFSVAFATAEEAGRFIDMIQVCGYHGRLVAARPAGGQDL
jgi:hypothetical protein